MSAAINPAPSPAPGAASASPGAAAGGAHAAHAAAQANDPVAAFEAMLSALFGAQGLGADGAAPGGGAVANSAATNAKAGAGAKTVTDDDKAKTDGDGDGKSANADAATTTLDASLALLTPVLPAAPAVAATAEAADGAAAQQAAVGVADKLPGQTAAGALAQLADPTAQPDDGKAKGQPAAIAVNGAATNAAAIAKTEAAASAAQPAAQPQTPPTGDAPPAQPPGIAVATAAVAATPAAQVAVPMGGKDAAPKDVGAKDKGPSPKAGARIDITKADATPGATAALTAKAADALQQANSAGAGFKAAPSDEDLQQSADETTTETGAAPQTPGGAAAPPPTAAATLIHAAAVAARGGPQTVASLAAQIVKKLDGRATQFDIQLDPAGLGKVDVRVSIAADGRMSAAMSFDTPQAAAELRARASELQQALEQSGFDLSGGMSFDVASDRGQGGQAQNQKPDSSMAFRGRAFQAALDTSADAMPPPQLTLRRTALAGVDIRI